MLRKCYVFQLNLNSSSSREQPLCAHRINQLSYWAPHCVVKKGKSISATSIKSVCIFFLSIFFSPSYVVLIFCGCWEPKTLCRVEILLISESKTVVSSLHHLLQADDGASWAYQLWVSVLLQIPWGMLCKSFLPAKGNNDSFAVLLAFCLRWKKSLGQR